MISRKSFPLLAGLTAAGIAAVLVIIGVFRGNVPAEGRAVAIALLVGSGSWGLLIWALARTAIDVETDLQEGDREGS